MNIQDARLVAGRYCYLWHFRRLTLLLALPLLPCIAPTPAALLCLACILHAAFFIIFSFLSPALSSGLNLRERVWVSHGLPTMGRIWA